MEYDEMKELWARSDAKFEASMRLNTLLLQQWNLRGVDTSLRRLARGITFELIVNVLAIVLLGSFVAAHLHELRFLLPAVVLDLFAIALVIGNARQLAEISALDYDQPVVTIQKKLEALRVRRVRTTLAVLVSGPLLWLPILIVAGRAFFGLDVYGAGPAWLVANVLFGLAVIALAIVIARLYGKRFATATPMRWLADELAGRSLAAALASLDSIRRFEAEE